MARGKPIALVDPAPREIPKMFLSQDLEDLKTVVDLQPADVRQEPTAAQDHPARSTTNVLLSPHRAGASPEALFEMGLLAPADIRQILGGLPPSACLRAERETVARMRSKPVSRT